jgi:hypothetical protein
MQGALRRPLRFAAGIPLVLGILGMGALGGGRDASAPLTDVRARLVDVDGTQTDVSHLTIGGETTLDGDVGRGRLRIPLERIARIELAAGGDDRDRLRATVTLREGAPVTVALRSSTTFYGQMPSGAFQIRARDLRSVELAR